MGRYRLDSIRDSTTGLTGPLLEPISTKGGPSFQAGDKERPVNSASKRLSGGVSSCFLYPEKW